MMRGISKCTWPDSPSTRDTLIAQIPRAREAFQPYRHWILDRIFPTGVTELLKALPFEAGASPTLFGTRGENNASRIYFTPTMRLRYPLIAEICAAFQDRRVTAAIARTTEADLEGTSLRIEYALDTQDFWMAPHTDIRAKRLSMLIYLANDLDHEHLGTDLYDCTHRKVVRVPFFDNSALVFVPSDRTWHGFEKRPFNGVRKSLIVNYIAQRWREKDQLAFPDTPVGCWTVGRFRGR